MKVLLPTPKFRSNTAMSGDTDLRDENVFSAVVVANGGTGNTKIFLVYPGDVITVGESWF